MKKCNDKEKLRLFFFVVLRLYFKTKMKTTYAKPMKKA